MGPSPLRLFLHAKRRLLDQNDKSLRVPAIISGFCMQNNNFWITITSLYGSQTSPVFLCMKNSEFCHRITSLCRSQTSPVFLCMQNRVFCPRITSLCIGPRPHLSFFACKTACLAPEFLVSMSPSPHLWLLEAKQRLWVENNKSL